MLTGSSSVDSRKLLYFAAAVELGSLKKAAKVFLISQPAMSTSMDRLEASLGIKLLERSAKGVTPTAFGNILYGHARAIRNEIELAKRNIAKLVQGEERPIRIGSLPSVASNILPLAIGNWQERPFQSSFQIAEKSQVELIAGLLHREFDLVLGCTSWCDIENGLRQRVLFRDRLFVFARSSHPLSAEASLSWGDLLEFPWACPTSRDAKTLLCDILYTANVNKSPRFTVCGSVAFLKSFLIHSDHLALLPVHAVQTELMQGKIRIFPINVPQMNRNVAVYFREEYQMNASCRALICCIEDAAQEIVIDPFRRC